MIYHQKTPARTRLASVLRQDVNSLEYDKPNLSAWISAFYSKQLEYPAKARYCQV